MVCAGGDIAGVRPQHRRAHHFPLAHRRDRDVAGNRPGKRFGKIVGLGQLGIGNLAFLRFLGDCAVSHSQCGAVGLPALGGQIDEQFARGSRPAADGTDRPWRGAAAGGHSIVGRQGRVGHDEPHSRRVQSQFLRGGLRDLGARALTHLDLARHHGDGSVAIDMQPRGDIRGAAASKSSSPPAAATPAALLRHRNLARNGDQ